MPNEYSCPLVNTMIDETVCYDIQMVTGPGNLINRSILEYYTLYFDINQVTDERVAEYCVKCPFNQLYGPVTKSTNAYHAA